MAIAVDSTILSSDMQSWYTRLNTILSRAGGPLETLAVPAAGKIAQATDVNNVVYKINSMKSDAYLGSISSLYSTYNAVSVGQLIQASTGTQLNQVISNLEAIKCRNDATKTFGCNQSYYSGNNNVAYTAWSNSAYSGWSQSYYSGNSRNYCSYGKKSNASKQNGDQCSYWSQSSYSGWSQSYYSGNSQSGYTAWSNSSYSGWSQSTCNNTTQKDILNSRSYVSG